MLILNAAFAAEQCISAPALTDVTYIKQTPSKAYHSSLCIDTSQTALALRHSRTSNDTCNSFLSIRAGKTQWDLTAPSCKSQKKQLSSVEQATELVFLLSAQIELRNVKIGRNTSFGYWRGNVSSSLFPCSKIKPGRCSLTAL